LAASGAQADGQLINKVAGLYGLITILVGGTFTQLVFYAYSTASLFAFLWALKSVKSVRTPMMSLPLEDRS